MAYILSLAAFTASLEEESNGHKDEYRDNQKVQYSDEKKGCCECGVECARCGKVLNESHRCNYKVLYGLFVLYIGHNNDIFADESYRRSSVEVKGSTVCD